MSGLRRLLMGTIAQAVAVVARSAGLTPSAAWTGYFPQPGPWSLFKNLTVSVNNPTGEVLSYVWSWEPTSESGGAAMAITSGQGTDTAQFNATCPGGAESGGGELTGTILCTVTDEAGEIYATVLVNLGFGQIP